MSLERNAGRVREAFDEEARRSLAACGGGCVSAERVGEAFNREAARSAHACYESRTHGNAVAAEPEEEPSGL